MMPGLNIAWQWIASSRNYGAKLIVKHSNTLVAQHFYSIKITTTWKAIPNKVVSSRTMNSFKNHLDKHWAENPPNVRVNCMVAIIDALHNWSVYSRRPAFCWKLLNGLSYTTTTTSTTSTSTSTVHYCYTYDYISPSGNARTQRIKFVYAFIYGLLKLKLVFKVGLFMLCPLDFTL